MNVLLKIIAGPNTGAEVILPEGVRISLGRSDDCDIILADDTLPAKACEIEASSSAAEIFNYDGTDESLKFFHVKHLSQVSAIAIGPETGEWEALVYSAKKEEASPSEEEPQVSQASPEPFKPKRKCSFKILLAIVMLGAAMVFFFGMNFSEEVSLEPIEDKVIDPMEGLLEMAGRYNLSVSETSGAVVVSGVLPTQKDRIAATAEAYRTMKGIKLEIGDDESISHGAAETLRLVGAFGLSVEGAKGGRLSLKGAIAGKEDLMRALEAIRAEVPYLKDIVCSNVMVACDLPDRVPVKVELRQPQIKVAGIIAYPHPCIVLKDGTRLAEGAEIGGFSIEKISAESVLVRSAEGVIKWQP